MSEPLNLMYLAKTLSPAERAENESYCHVCLSKCRLTKEHIPPRSAFNASPRLWDDLVAGNGEVTSRRRMCQAGFWTRSLCPRCNNAVCAPYAKEYVQFIRSLAETAPIVDARGQKRLFAINFSPLRIAKEIATMILAVENVFFARHNLDLRSFVLDSQARFTPPFEVWAFVVPRHRGAGTISPLHARVDSFQHGYRFAGGEISGYPFGFVHGNDPGPSYALENLTNITGWFSDSSPQGKYQYLELSVRLTGVDSIQSGLFGIPRDRPHSDRRFFQ